MAVISTNMVQYGQKISKKQYLYMWTRSVRKDLFFVQWAINKSQAPPPPATTQYVIQLTAMVWQRELTCALIHQRLVVVFVVHQFIVAAERPDRTAAIG